LRAGAPSTKTEQKKREGRERRVGEERTGVRTECPRRASTSFAGGRKSCEACERVKRDVEYLGDVDEELARAYERVHGEAAKEEQVKMLFGRFPRLITSGRDDDEAAAR
jgi:hypothetical protein